MGRDIQTSNTKRSNNLFWCCCGAVQASARAVLENELRLWLSVATEIDPDQFQDMNLPCAGTMDLPRPFSGFRLLAICANPAQLGVLHGKSVSETGRRV